MKVFDFYTTYYDLLYQEKDYAEEVEYVLGMIEKYGNGKSILELGCGTGAHSVFMAEEGIKVHGIDLSEKMIAAALEKMELSESRVKDMLSFEVGNVCNYRRPEFFDAVISLFHVMSYQTTNRQLNDTFATAAAHLKQGGIFLFDFWYGPAVLKDLPRRRIKKLENDQISLKRIAEPVMHPNKNIVDVNYYLIVKRKSSGKPKEIHEKHSMRYLFYPELLALSKLHGFSIVASHKWMTKEPLSFESWNGVLVCMKL